MLTWLKSAFAEHGELAVFLAVGVGALLGRVPLGRHARVGLIPGTLVAGVVIGDLTDVKIPPEVSGVFFTLFLFGIGYKVGPQFFRGLRATGLQQAAVGLVMALTGLAVAFGLATILGFGPGEAGGLLAGGLTQSSAVATATDTVDRLGLSASDADQQASLVAVGYAVTYLFGAAGAAWWTSTMLPRIFRFDLREATARYRAELGQTEEQPGASGAYTLAVHRTYLVTSDLAVGHTIGELEAAAAQRGHRVFAIGVRRDGVVLDPDPNLELEMDDLVAITGRRDAVVAEHLARYGEEVDDPDLLGWNVETIGAVVTHSGLAGRTIGDIRRTTFERGVFMSGLIRSGVPVVLSDDAPIQSGDELKLTGPMAAVERTAAVIGFADRETPESDVALICLGVVAGGIAGLPSIDAANATLRLGASVGALIAGLLFGWLRSRRPTFGKVPPAAQWIFDTFALALAIAAIGINAGPGFVDGISDSGLPLLLGGVLVTLVPLTLGMAVAYRVFRMPAPIAIGAVAGALTSTPSLAAANDQAESQLPTLGYTVPYAIGNVLLTLLGSAIVLLVG